MVTLGALAVGTEYRGGQIRTALLAVPGRPRPLGGKAVVPAAAALAVAAVTVVASFTATQIGLGEHGLPTDRLPESEVLDAMAGAVVYRVPLALLSAGLTAVVRNTAVSMVVLIAMALSFHLSMLTGLADYLPDRTGAQMFALDGFQNTPWPPSRAER
ncbi:hypothetical protein PWG71_08955 [Nocardiopsis sp. N85]|uniref:hypothetical protein n=1 Tax=Nocardiopsis sp. N85 TaxID=3029400 RepID=UPI00237F02F1|nr:hypothetical protein [Nocardiopsis sp. N85]MDE3721515.1 hypothetical protein [Nocardiopsis sp. N85]